MIRLEYLTRNDFGQLIEGYRLKEMYLNTVMNIEAW